MDPTPHQLHQYNYLPRHSVTTISLVVTPSMRTPINRREITLSIRLRRLVTIIRQANLNDLVAVIGDLEIGK